MKTPLCLVNKVKINKNRFLFPFAAPPFPYFYTCLHSISLTKQTKQKKISFFFFLTWHFFFPSFFDPLHHHKFCCLRLCQRWNIFQGINMNWNVLTSTRCGELLIYQYTYFYSLFLSVCYFFYDMLRKQKKSILFSSFYVFSSSFLWIIFQMALIQQSQIA